jgi:quinol monooxygenase YgiN
MSWQSYLRIRHQSLKEISTMSLFGGSDSNSATAAKITVVAQIRAKSGHEDEVRSAFTKVVGPSQKEAGCIKYNLYEDKHYTGSFFTIEEWESEEALEVHLQVNKEALNRAKTLLREDLRISVLKFTA